ncbi:MAG: hypothetical protein V7676_09505 [Parasphingorhabdus sp.]|uniref:hypothetical protein n=1 Tax=Parasphingorhabdus sp. TaxID=2709688 RepID=UPI0030019289
MADIRPVKVGALSSKAAASLPNAALNASANGALYGGIGGALNESGDGRLQNAAGGAIGGAVGGAVLAPLLRGGMATGTFARQNIPGVDQAVSSVGNVFNKMANRAPDRPAAQQQAQRIIADEMGNGTIATGMGTGSVPLTAETVTDEIAKRDLMGIPAMPADLSEQLRRITSWSLQGRGAMTTKARAALGERQAKQGQRIRDHVQSELGPAVDPIKAVDDIRYRASAEAAPNYRQAYNEGMTVSTEMQEIMKTPAFKQEAAKAFKEIRDYGGNPKDFGFIQRPDGSVDFGETPSLEAIDMIIKKIRMDIPRNPLTGRPELDSSNFRASGMASGLDEEARKGSPLFDTAKSKYADEMAIRDALEQGQNVGKMSGHEIAASTRAMPEHAQEAWITGARTSLADNAVAAGQKPTANVAQNTRNKVGLSGAGSAASPGDVVKVDAIENLTGKPGSMGRLDDRLEAEDQGFKTFSEAFLNSKTNARESLDENLMAGITQTGRDLLFGNIASAVGGVLFRGTAKGSFKFKQDVQDSIAEILTETKPDNIKAAFEAIQQRAAHDRKFSALLNKAGVQVSRLSATQLGGADGDPIQTE